MKYKLQQIITIILFPILFGFVTNAQIYPIQTNIIIQPPYPLHLETFSQSGFDIAGKINASLLMNDNTHFDYLVALKLVIEGPGGMFIETQEDLKPTIQINFGSNQISGLTLESLFNYNNMDFSNFSFGSGSCCEFVEGMYRFRIEVYDIERNVLISNPYAGIYTAWITRYEPPFLLMPLNNISLNSEITPLNTVFSWTPRGIIPISTDIRYTLEIAEMNNTSPDASAEAAFEGEGTLLYNISNIQTTSSIVSFPNTLDLSADKWYAWRIKANDENGNVYYRGEGYSEARKFYFGTTCEKPQNFNIVELNETTIQLNWVDTLSAEYGLEFRNKTVLSSWTEIGSPYSGIELTGFSPGVTYEFRLYKVCSKSNSESLTLEYTAPGEIECTPPDSYTAEIDTSIIFGNKLKINWNPVPGVINYQVDARCNLRTLSKRLSGTSHSFRWSENGIYGDTIWIRFYSQCVEGGDYIPGEEQLLVMTEGTSTGGDCIAPFFVIDSAITYNAGITQIYWPHSNLYERYTLQWRPAGLAIEMQNIDVISPPATVEGILPGDSIECQMVYHCLGGNTDTSNITGFKTILADDIITTGTCWEPSYLRHYIPELTTLQLMWEEEPDANSYEVNWRKLGENTWNIGQTDETEFLIQYLMSDSSYQYRVRTVCGDGLGFSRWTDILLATLDSVSSPFTGCPPPEYGEVNISGSSAASLSFAGEEPYTGYGAEYRINETIDWSEALSLDKSVHFQNLLANTQYQFRVRGFCGLQISEYTMVDTFSTPEALINDSLICGDAYSGTITNTTEISLAKNDKFMASGWQLFIDEIDQNGNGFAFARVSYLKNATVQFELQNIKVNEDSVMYDGLALMKGVNVQLIDPILITQIEDLLDDAELGLEQVEIVIDQLEDLVDNIPDLGGGTGGGGSGCTGCTANELFEMGMDSLTAALDTLSSLTIEGIIEGGGLAHDGVEILQEALEALVAQALNQEVLAPLDSCVTFTSLPGEALLFDKYRYYGSEPQYNVLQTIYDEDYYVAYKALSANIANRVHAILPTDARSQTLSFKINTKEGAGITDTEIGVNAEGKMVREFIIPTNTERIFAYDSIFLPGDGTTTADTTVFMCVGQLNVESYNLKQRNVVLVPVNGANELSGTNISDGAFLTALQDSLNSIYSPANVNWTISTHTGITVNDVMDGMEDSDDKILTRYTADMNMVIDAFMAETNPAENTYYMFVVQKYSGSTKEGYMPFGKEFGFLMIDETVTLQEEFIRTTAHELGHGAFKLRHTFSPEARYPLTPSTTDNLMDYVTDTKLFNYQWELIDNPAFMITWFQDEEESAMILTTDKWVMRKYIEEFRWANINDRIINYNGTYVVKAENIKLADGKDPYSKIVFYFKKNGPFQIKTSWNEEPITADDGMVEISFSDELIIRVTPDRLQDLLDYLYANEDLFTTQINQYVNILSADDKMVLKIIKTLPEESQNNFDGAFKTNWINALIKERPDNYETLIVNIVKSITVWQDKKTLLLSLTNNICNMRYFTGHLSGDNEKDFIIKISQFLKEVVPPDLDEIERQYFNYEGDIYVKILSWEETLGPDIIFQSEESSYTCEIYIKTKNDWISIFQDDDYLMTLDPFEYVGLAAENALPYLPDGFIVGETVVIMPAFMLHWLLQFEERQQVLDDVATLADMGFTIVTFGTYAAGKNIIVYGGKYATGAIVDMVLQIGVEALMGNSFDEALNNIDYGQIFYSGVESLLPGWRLQVGINCLREATIGSLNSGEFDIGDIAYTCFENLFFNAVSHGLIKKGSVISNKLENALQIAPDNVVKNLKTIGFDRDMVEWIASHTGVEITEFIVKYYD
jgi:hypothetical protein